MIEYTGNDYRNGLVAASFNWHAWKELKLLAAPGAEYGFAIGKGFEIAPPGVFTHEEGMGW